MLAIIKRRLFENWKSGLTVALISIPLSLSLAVASGASPEAGIITAVWAGFFAALFGGSHFNIIGPAGALTGVLGAFAITHGPALLPTAAVLTGVCVLIAYFFKLERYLVLIPRSVMHGFSLGVALIIATGQLASVLGIQHLGKHAHLMGTLGEICLRLSETHGPTVLLFGLFFVGLFVLARYVPRVPGAVIATPVGIFVGWLTTQGLITGDIVLLADRFSTTSISFFTPATFSFDAALVVPAVAIAFIAILETLISAKIADGMTGTRFNSRKEVFGLSIANIVSGVFGGLPATGVFVRTGVNVKSGATHKTSSIINAVCVALITGLLYKYFTFLPMAVIGAILMFAAVRMMEIAHLRGLWRVARKDFIVAIVVAVGMVAIDSVVGLLIGTALALLYFVEKLSEGHCEITVNSEDKKLLQRLYTSDATLFVEGVETIVYSIKGPLTYINAEAHVARVLAKQDTFSTVVFRMREIGYIDHDGFELFEELVHILQKKGKKVYLSSVSKDTEKVLTKSSVFSVLLVTHTFATTRLALSHLGFTEFA